MRFALYADRAHMTWDRLFATWVEADQIDLFESAWTWDHLYVYDETLNPSIRGRLAAVRDRLRRHRRQQAPEGVGPCPDGWVSLAALLQATNRLRGGCLVTGMVYRHPAVLAKMASTVDTLSGGRLELGLGTGWSQREDEAYGLEIGDAKARADRFEEGASCLVSLTTQDTTTFHGRYYRLQDARCDPKPVQRPHPPICIGGAGEQRTIPGVARWAERWHPGFDLDALPRKREALAQRCAEIDRDPADITVMMVVDWDGQSSVQLTDHVERLAVLGVDMAVVRIAHNDPGLVEPAGSALQSFEEPHIIDLTESQSIGAGAEGGRS